MIGILGCKELDIPKGEEEEIRGIDISPFGRLAFYESKKILEVWINLTDKPNFMSWHNTPCLDIYMPKSFDLSFVKQVKTQSPKELMESTLDFIFSHMDYKDIFSLLTMAKAIGIDEGKVKRSNEIINLLNCVNQ